MFQNPALVQHLSDAKMADLRRDRRHRTDEIRHDIPQRVVRPLLRWRSH
jgi:hypothetical protein